MIVPLNIGVGEIIIIMIVTSPFLLALSLSLIYNLRENSSPRKKEKKSKESAEDVEIKKMIKSVIYDNEGDELIREEVGYK